jgi:hypothetical protein
MHVLRQILFCVGSRFRVHIYIETCVVHVDQTCNEIEDNHIVYPPIQLSAAARPTITSNAQPNPSSRTCTITTDSPAHHRVTTTPKVAGKHRQGNVAALSFGRMVEPKLGNLLACDLHLCLYLSCRSISIHVHISRPID